MYTLLFILIMFLFLSLAAMVGVGLHNLLSDYYAKKKLNSFGKGEQK